MPDTPARAWSLIAVPPEARQYGGNMGHVEDYRILYRYDKDVPNHLQLSTGDLIFIRGKTELLGVARVGKIDKSTVDKVRQRCPTCGNSYVKRRKMNPIFPWRCGNGHEFATPIQLTETVPSFTAHYASTFVPAPAAFSLGDLKAAALRPNDQVSIEEVDVRRLKLQLVAAPGGVQELITEFMRGATLAPTDAETEGEDADDDFLSPGGDRREKVLRAIRQRRGQRSFREKLRKRFKDRCVVSACGLVDLLEAAHIDPYRGVEDNHQANGLLLRADLHTLFDLYLMSIEPATMAVRLNPRATAAGYADFEGKVLFVGTARPALAPLQRHWELFQKQLAI